MLLDTIRKGSFILPLPHKVLRLLGQIAYRKTQLPVGKQTEKHAHKFFSFYIVDKVQALRTKKTGRDLSLPNRALVIVLPFVEHGWTNRRGRTDDAFVYDLTPFHGEHVIN